MQKGKGGLGVSDEVGGGGFRGQFRIGEGGGGGSTWPCIPTLTFYPDNLQFQLGSGYISRASCFHLICSFITCI